MNIVKFLWWRWRFRNNPISIYDHMRRIKLQETIQHGLLFLQQLQDSVSENHYHEVDGKIAVHDLMTCSCGFVTTPTAKGFREFMEHECWPNRIEEVEKVNV